MLAMGPPRKSFILILLSLTLFSVHMLFFQSSDAKRSTPETLLPEPSFQRDLQNASPFTFIIKVLTYNRLHALSRCLRSLASADYTAASGRVHLHLYIDHFSLSRNDTPVEESLHGMREILDFIDGFEWRFGSKFVHYRTDNAGLQAQWLEAWWPSSDHEFAFVVEDDLEVSPLYFKFLNNVILKYYYDASNFSPFIYGASLQRPRFVPGKHGNKIHLEEGTRLFLYQLVGTWGQLLFPKPWKEFRLWYDEHKAKGIKPILGGMVTTGWYKKMGERIWTPWFIKFIHSRGYYNIYTNFGHERALSVSHRDAGVNYGKTVGPDSQLLNESWIGSNPMETQSLRKLKWFDFCFREVFPGRLAKTRNEVRALLSSVASEEGVVVVSLFGASEITMRNMICHFERLSMRNYVLFGPTSDLLIELSRRGYPVIDADQFFVDVVASSLVKKEAVDSDTVKEMLAKAHVIKMCLEEKQSCFVGNSNMLLIGNKVIRRMLASAHDFHVGAGSGVVFVRYSSSSEKLWSNNLMQKVRKAAERVSNEEGSRDFMKMVWGLLDEEGIKMQAEDEIGIDDMNGMPKAGRADLVFWDSKIGFNKIRNKLENLDLWIIDEDHSCKAVVCDGS